MQLLDVRRFNTKLRWQPVYIMMVAAALLTSVVFATTAAAAGNTYVVDDDGQATTNNCNSSTPTLYSTVSAAVTAAAAGDTVKVCPGAYAESVVVDKALYLKGARAGDAVSSRSFGAGNESTVTGLVTVAAADVKVEGFSLTNPGQGLGVLVKTAATNAVVKRNIVQTVGSNTFVGPTVGVYLELGPDEVTVSDNKISDIQSQTGSAQGILVGDSTSADPSLEAELSDNSITNITSLTRGAYGIQVNNGASTVPTATGYTEVEITGNTIRTLSGAWVHAIGLEGETPNVVVTYNTISGLTDINPTPVADAAAVFFESNPFFFTGAVNNNHLAVGAASHGIALHPTLAVLYPSLRVDGECNWWGSSTGPGAVATGTGSQVTSGVDYKPWLKSSNLGRSCDDNDHHHYGRHHGGWRSYHDKWHN